MEGFWLIDTLYFNRWTILTSPVDEDCMTNLLGVFMAQPGDGAPINVTLDVGEGTKDWGEGDISIVAGELIICWLDGNKWWYNKWENILWNYIMPWVCAIHLITINTNIKITSIKLLIKP